MRPNDCTNRHAENCLADARRDVFRPRPFAANVGICGGLILICTRGDENLKLNEQNKVSESVKSAIDFPTQKTTYIYPRPRSNLERIECSTEHGRNRE